MKQQHVLTTKRRGSTVKLERDQQGGKLFFQNMTATLNIKVRKVKFPRLLRTEKMLSTAAVLNTTQNAVDACSMLFPHLFFGLVLFSLFKMINDISYIYFVTSGEAIIGEYLPMG